MSPWTSKAGSKHEHEQDLSALLTTDERAELTLLIVNITERMRKQILDTFNASIASEADAMSSKANEKNPNVDSDKSHEATEEEEKARKMREKRAKELSVPKMLELKDAALDYFQKWNDSVVTRLGTIMNKAGTASEDKKEDTSNVAAANTDLKPDTKVISPDTNTEDADAALVRLYPPTSTSLYSLPKEKRVLLLHAVLLLLLGLENYASYSRVLLLHLSSSLHLPLHILVEHEVKISQGLIQAAKHMSGTEEAEKRSESNKVSHAWKVGLAGVAGAAVIGVTGGLAAPLVAGAVGTIMAGLGLEATAAATLLGALAESSVVVGALFGAYGGRMTSKMIDAYAKEVEDFAFLPLGSSKHHLRYPDDPRLRVTIGISGWLEQKEDVITPWRALGHQSEVFALRWELEALTSLGTSMEVVAKSAAWSVAKKQIIKRTIFASLMEALWPLSILKISKIVDNPFSVAKNRADKAGLVLADALINKAQGERPVTLIGYSMGARLIYSCLLSLAERKAFGLVENVVLMGTPAPSTAPDWRAMRSVVAGRVVNVYSENDLILAFLYRTSSIHLGVAGLQQIEDVKGVESVDVSDLVSGHRRYQFMVGSILKRIDFEDIDLKEVAEEEETVALMDEAEKKEDEEKQKSGGDVDDEDVDKMEQQVKHKTDHTMMEKMTESLHLHV
ncbi:hypothetical protein F5884DRAFT_782414 [Xylogone sp. PMI_703]|nr:hypothetical protein F5884DRAFT_782414 [Xylogone sp. PMI_703]